MKKILYTIFVTLFFGSCTEKIDLDIPNNDPILVVEAEVTTELDSSYVKLTLSSNYFGPQAYPVVSNATVTVNNVPFVFNSQRNLYKPALGYVAKPDSTYNLSVIYNGKEYKSQSTLTKMFKILGDSLFQRFKPKEGFLPAGYSINYNGFDDRPRIRYTYFKLGFFDPNTQRDSANNFRVLFTNEVIPFAEPYSFELPFTRYQPGDEFFCTFRSIDKNMYDFISAYSQQSTGAPGPFQVPAANLPSNVSPPPNEKVVGYFATYDVKRLRYIVK
jgi:hypothetical protein